MLKVELSSIFIILDAMTGHIVLLNSLKLGPCLETFTKLQTLTFGSDTFRLFSGTGWIIVLEVVSV